MNVRGAHTTVALIALAISAVAIGCASSAKRANPTATQLPNDRTQEQPQVAQRQDFDPQQVAIPQAETEPDVIARRAEQYSREMEALLKNRPVNPSPASESARSVPSEVKWIDPNEFHLGDFHARSSDGQGPPWKPTAVTVRPRESAGRSTAAQGEAGDPTQAAVSAAANVPIAQIDPATQPSVTPRHPIASSSAGQLSAKLSTRIRDYPREVASHLEYQLLKFLEDEQVPELASLAALPTEDRELVTAVLDGLSMFRSTLRSDNNMLLSHKIRPLIEMADRLRSQADLTLPTVQLCRSVAGFGKYEPLEPARFAAGKEHQAIVYCEVANFASNLNDKRMWETKLKQELVLYTEQGAEVWNDKSSDIKDESRNRRHDFFIATKVKLPGNLTIGRYLLKVSIIDIGANRVAEDTVPIIIAAN